VPLAGMRQITIPAGQRTLVYRQRFSSIPPGGVGGRDRHHRGGGKALMPQPMQNFTSTWMALDTIEPTVAFTLAAPSFEP